VTAGVFNQSNVLPIVYVYKFSHFILHLGCEFLEFKITLKVQMINQNIELCLNAYLMADIDFYWTFFSIIYSCQEPPE
jgi:hypothetical protein